MPPVLVQANVANVSIPEGHDYEKGIDPSFTHPIRHRFDGLGPRCPTAAPKLKIPPSAKPPFVQGEVLLKAKPDASATGLATTVDASVARPMGDGSIVLLKRRSVDVPTAVAALKARASVAFAEPNWLRPLQAAPDDAGFNLK